MKIGSLRREVVITPKPRAPIVRKRIVAPPVVAPPDPIRRRRGVLLHGSRGERTPSDQSMIDKPRALNGGKCPRGVHKPIAAASASEQGCTFGSLRALPRQA
jgi:hypothetical protein